ncbi:hypothetical protein X740_16470 [Mesorhizobium sp. LNHC221B00]|nr:hypothetical protein X740_16470 [Mesorhizobium sp. LNHC221B00]
MQTAPPNALIKPIHEKTMPVILTAQEETETWLSAHGRKLSSCSAPRQNDARIVVEKPATQIKFPQGKTTSGGQLSLL